jgi:hypothetical protein
MALNFNVDPYYDDFDPSKHFHRILFKPGYAVQARELTQSQTILQDQISKFANHIFTQNTPVSGGKVTLNTRCYYLKLNEQYNGQDIVAADFLNKVIQDSTGTILAKVIATAESTTVDPPTLVVSYLSGVRFTDEMFLTPTDGTNYFATTIGTAGGTTCTGLSSTVSVSEGVFYIINGYSVSSTQNADGTYSKWSIGNFVTVSPQTIILDKYSNTPSYRIGLSITETITDYIDDSSLLDPAVGAANYQAPGADRYTILLTLTTLPLQVGNDDAFIELLRTNNGIISKQVNGTVYSVIDDYFAKRTYDTNGDYVVNDFKLTPAANTNPDNYNVNISKGLAYVRGYRLENQSDLTVSGKRARDTANVNNNPVSIEYGNFFAVSNAKGSSANGLFNYTILPTVDLHTVYTANIVSANANTYNSTKVGTARIRGFEYEGFKTSASDPTGYIFNAYVTDLSSTVLSSNASAANSTSITFYDPYSKFSSVNDSYRNVTLTIDSGTSKGDTRTIINYNGSTKVATVDQAFSTTPDTTSNVSLRFAIKDIDSIVVANSLYYPVSSADIDNTGKENGISTGATILRDPGTPDLLFDIGQPYVASLSDTSYSSSKIFRNKSFSGVGTISAAITLPSSLAFRGTGTLSSSEVLNYFTVVRRSDGRILNWTGAGNTISISADKLTATLSSSTLTTPLSVDVISKVNVTNADNTSYILKAKNLVAGNTNVATGTGGTLANTYNYVDLTNGQTYIQNAGIVSFGKNQSLFVSDVKKIVKIIDTLNPSTAPTVDMLSSASNDITSYYYFNNGQKDSYYDHSYITLKPGAPKPKGNILVVYNYYSHSGGDGYFSVMSYLSPTSSSPESYAEIGTYTATNGATHSLKDCLDFRPTRKNATNTFEFDWTTNPASTDSGYYVPDNLSTFTGDYSYYLGKKSLIVLSKDRNFQLIDGKSAVNPVYPKEPDGALVIGKISLDPYTAYLPSEVPSGKAPNLSIASVQHKRWAMQDISNLNSRVNNLEYYTALSLLEQRASSLQVKDSNGLNRFKNGILVDDFSSFLVADTSNPDFSCAIDKVLRQVVPQQTVTNFPLQNLSLVKTNGRIDPTLLSYNVSKVNSQTNIFTLPYTTSNVITQQLASSVISVNPFNVVEYEGVLDITPPIDNWVDNTKAPDLVIVDPDLQIFQQSDTTNLISQSNWKVIPGTENSSTTVTSGRNWQTTTTTITGTLSQQTVLGNYTKLDNTYKLDMNFITDISIQPYIRPQQIFLRGRGLKVNTPLKAWFDGQRVDEYISQPDSIELTNVVGTFKEDDTIGYYSENIFHPIATIASVYKYPGTNNVRLYIIGNQQTAFYSIGDEFDGTIRNVTFDANGNYKSYSAIGTVTTSQVIDVHKAGTVSLVGGTWQDRSANTLSYYRVNVSHGSFAEMFGIWGKPDARGATLPAGTFTFTAPTTGKYWLRVSSDDNKSGYIRVTKNNSTWGANTYWTTALQSGSYNDLGDPSLTYINLVAGTHKFQIYCTSSQDDGDAYIAAAITGPADTKPWNSEVTSTAPIILSTATLHGSGFANTTPTDAGTGIIMPGGGTYYVGVTKFALSGIAANTADYYTGCTINIQTINVQKDVYGKTTTVTEKYKSTVSAYDRLTRTVTLSTPVNISLGMNSNINGDISSTYSIDGTVVNYSLGRQQNRLSKLSTDENGSISCIFNVPAGTFKTGERIFLFDDRAIDTDPTTADTFAKATFYATGLTTKSQSLNFGASISGAKNVFTQTDYRRNVVLSTTSNTITWDPLAQTFILDPENYPYGAFLDSVTLFFSAPPGSTSTTGTLKSVKGTVSPITLSILNTLNGYPNGETLDYSIVTVQSSEVNISPNPFYLDGSTGTKFKFSAPVYVQPGVLYAILLRSPSNDYYPYISVQGGTTIPSTSRAKLTDALPAVGQKIGNVPYVGSLFESQNGITWVADPTKSMMMVFDRCVFNTGVSPTINFGVPKGNPTRKNAGTSIQYFKDYNIVPNMDASYISSDVISDAYNFTTTDFIPSTLTSVSYVYNSVLNSTKAYAGEQLITPGKYACPTLQDIMLSDGKGPRVILANSDNTLLVNATLSSKDDTVSPIISDDGLSVYNVKYKINNLPLTNSQIVLVNAGTGYANGLISSSNIIVSSPDVIGGEQAVLAANVVNNIIDTIYVTYPGSGYLSKPTVTLIEPNTTIATVNVTSEFSPAGGNADCKYVTRKTVITQENVSQDLRVYFTAYRPVGTNFYVFYKILDPNDPEVFENNPWKLMTLVGDTKNTVSVNETDLYEFEAAPGTNGVPDNAVSYVGTNGITYYSFTTFAIKIVMTTNTIGTVTNDTTIVPSISELRVLALPSGTGL